MKDIFKITEINSNPEVTHEITLKGSATKFTIGMSYNLFFVDGMCPVSEGGYVLITEIDGTLYIEGIGNSKNPLLNGSPLYKGNRCILGCRGHIYLNGRKFAFEVERASKPLENSEKEAVAAH